MEEELELINQYKCERLVKEICDETELVDNYITGKIGDIQIFIFASSQHVSENEYTLELVDKYIKTTSLKPTKDFSKILAVLKALKDMEG